MLYNTVTGSKAAALAEAALDGGNGILRLTPTWVPRSFCVPGRRIKLHPDDYYAFGGERGGVDERWFASTTPADNGPLTSENEGLSCIVFGEGENPQVVLLKDAVESLKGELLGQAMWEKYGCWPMYSKFFDNKGALPHHVHHRDEHAALVGQFGKPEAYYFPPQVNNHGGDFPYTFFGLLPGTTKEQLQKCLKNFDKGDNKITDFSQAYKLRAGAAWNVPPGVLHAPGSMCTYEPQKASDVFAMYQSLTGDAIIPEDLLWKNSPDEKHGDYDYLVEVLDWEKNIDPNFAANNFMPPIAAHDRAEMAAAGYIENWICYKSPDFAAKELTVLPGKTVTITDSVPYGMIMMQGYGTFGGWRAETPSLIRFGQLTCDEYFVSASAAAAGVEITNLSASEPLVMLKHLGPGSEDQPLNL